MPSEAHLVDAWPVLFHRAEVDARAHFFFLFAWPRCTKATLSHANSKRQTQ